MHDRCHTYSRRARRRRGGADRTPGVSNMQQDATQQGASSFKLSQRFAVIIANPVSGFFLNNAQRFSETLFFLRKHGWRAELWYTEAPGDGQRLAQKAVEQGADVVIAAGGDGTINEIIQVL